MSDPQPIKHPRSEQQFRTCSIAGVGSYVPEKVLTNADLEKMVETSDEWIKARTGIAERRVVADGETVSDLGVKSAERALEMAKVRKRDVDLVLVLGGVSGSLMPRELMPDGMKRAMAKQAEAERERRAKIIHAEGEFSAAARLAQATGGHLDTLFLNDPLLVAAAAGLQLWRPWQPSAPPLPTRTEAASLRPSSATANSS